MTPEQTGPLAAADARRWSTRRPGDGVRLQNAEADGRPFLVTRDADDAQHIVMLDPEPGRVVTVGRADAHEVTIAWDPQVSADHCELELVGTTWMLRDSQSTNGTRLNNQRIVSRVRLHDGDAIRVGRTDLLFRQPRPARVASTVVSGGAWEVEVTPRQREVLIELARPRVTNPGDGATATNEQIARALGITVDAVKRNLGLMFEKFALGAVPPGNKRSMLVARALQLGVITEADFG
jgi:pSer/pThr/pTyr-binding forkhead associated (FHA) protein